VVGGVIWLASQERGTYNAASATEAAAGSPDYGLQRAEEASSQP
jgi:hypothetical protein